ncbi:lactonase family protein [Paenibacillus lignilyticus]|uniref:Beta-propeller fold lactonase family protein n=1 Tax=Paenibacillus lignilyticus TaxID=1172615 RepID=A0ABS5CBV6_9BACL|nr:beta-propeller fold lactonase family protein [Paenibacillus lignilyticus]MBP3962945.1 beta-propeller fold lactonase family protein [Paenibacillus lignilyticus]
MPNMVYMMTNMEVNQVIVFYREINGTLTIAGRFPTYGSGSGVRGVNFEAAKRGGIDPLSSQGALTLSPDGHFLFAVNAGNHSISSFIISNNGLPVLADVKPSGGAQPTSIAVFGNLLYVANVGNAANNFTSNISGFRIDQFGRLTSIPGSTHSLSSLNAQPSQVLFNPDGRKIIVSEISTNLLSVFHVNQDGTVTGPIINESNGMLPFGSLFLSSGVLLVTEAGSNALSSYSLNPNGRLDVISGSVPTGQKATCWVAVTKDEQFAFTPNTSSGTIAVYHIDRKGALTFLRNVASTPEGVPTGLPMDVGVSKDGRYFYVLNGNQGTISAFHIKDDGNLTIFQVAASSKAPYFGSQGLAVL